MSSNVRYALNTLILWDTVDWGHDSISIVSSSIMFTAGNVASIYYSEGVCKKPVARVCQP